MTVQVGIPPALYVFRDVEGRVTYIGKAFRNPGDRVKDHFDKRQPWALAGPRLTIEVHYFPGLTDAQLQWHERQWIEGLAPLGNIQHNRGRRDQVWVHSVRVGALRASGDRVPVTMWLRGLGLRVRGFGVRLVRLGGWSLGSVLVYEVVRQST